MNDCCRSQPASGSVLNAAAHPPPHLPRVPLPQPQNAALELQVPPDCGAGYCNAGVSLARLLWHVPAPAMASLLASLLLERRVVLVGKSRDMVSGAAAAAAALIYPFK